MKFKAIVEYEYPIEHKPPVKAELILHGDRVVTDSIEPLSQEPKSEWEHDHEILKAYSDGSNEVLDKIRTEIKQYQSDYDVHGTEYDRTAWKAFNRCLQIINKYKTESEENK